MAIIYNLAIDIIKICILYITYNEIFIKLIEGVSKIGLIESVIIYVCIRIFSYISGFSGIKNDNNNDIINDKYIVSFMIGWYIGTIILYTIIYIIIGIGIYVIWNFIMAGIIGTFVNEISLLESIILGISVNILLLDIRIKK